MTRETSFPTPLAISAEAKRVFDSAAPLDFRSADPGAIERTREETREQYAAAFIGRHTGL